MQTSLKLATTPFCVSRTLPKLFEWHKDTSHFVLMSMLQYEEISLEFSHILSAQCFCTKMSCHWVSDNEILQKRRADTERLCWSEVEKEFSLLLLLWPQRTSSLKQVLDFRTENWTDAYSMYSRSSRLFSEHILPKLFIARAV